MIQTFLQSALIAFTHISNNIAGVQMATPIAAPNVGIPLSRAIFYAPAGAAVVITAMIRISQITNSNNKKAELS